MNEVKTHAQLVRDGFAPHEIRRMARSGSLVAVRRGAYVEPGGALDPEAEHRRLVLATMAQTMPGAVVSHVSAATLHGLPVPYADLARVHVTRDRDGGGRARRWVQIHGAALPPDQVTSVDGVAVTSIPRTFVDVARTLTLSTSVALGDAILRSGTDRTALEEAADRGAGRHGIGAARRALAFLDKRSESAGESISRVLLSDLGLLPVEPQLILRNEHGEFVARVDFGWPELGVVAEFDGRVKYGRRRPNPLDPTKILWSEKVREDQIRQLGWQVVRWTWDDLSDLTRLLRRLEQAFARARLTTRTGSYETS